MYTKQLKQLLKMLMSSVTVGVMTECIASVNARLNVNVALNRPSYQVSTFSKAIVYEAKYANDGNNGTDLVSSPCAHTGTATNPWWAVDLGVALRVYGVKFTNRNNRGTYTVSSVKIL